MTPKEWPPGYGATSLGGGFKWRVHGVELPVPPPAWEAVVVGDEPSVRALAWHHFRKISLGKEQARKAIAEGREDRGLPHPAFRWVATDRDGIPMAEHGVTMDVMSLAASWAVVHEMRAEGASVDWRRCLEHLWSAVSMLQPSLVKEGFRPESAVTVAEEVMDDLESVRDERDHLRSMVQDLFLDTPRCSRCGKLPEVCLTSSCLYAQLRKAVVP